ncbi:Arm DNA-binding domain-containing protein [Burkholderia sp. BCC0397]|uniref:Arm DNA-binding domain-containing protein n=1 Tax=Burkholderia sp. BCC0397 TaxID=486876 RepID=UPI003267099C
MLVRRFACNRCQSGAFRPSTVRSHSLEIALGREKTGIACHFQGRRPRLVVPLADVKIRRANTDDKPTKLTGANGPYLGVRPSGAKLWRYRYRIAGKENLFAIDEYPPLISRTAGRCRSRIRLAPFGTGRQPENDDITAQR